ncbi:two-component system, sensor histidine kinase YesM [Anaerocolumna jejuensis DSM 15929]|uniref:Two-component system, sensor histidine kinase YesM n=1 Tax=Anaerocolumna jejuensis DSM 15929 TaxID=1121322 RepID=A0A1M7CZE4_9FIRM|nr:histidine kinase [Anaerocolumna jejuensis]SHL72642.1 two-component system, sensor histidine kinase YesM [Anaerocolumna jejuensis DSM 15929]
MKFKSISLKKHLIFTMGIFVIPMIFCLLFYNYYSIKTLNNEVAQSGKNTINLYQSQVEYDLQKVSQTIADYWANNYDHANMIHKVDKLTKHLSGYEIGLKYRTLLTNNQNLGSICLVSEKNDLQRFFYQESRYSIETKEGMSRIVEEYLLNPKEKSAKGWQPFRVNGEGFLVRLLGYNGGYTFLFVDLSVTIQNQIKNRSEGEGFLYYTTMRGEALSKQEEVGESELVTNKLDHEYYLTENEAKYLVVNQYSDLLHVRFFYFIPYKGYFFHMDRMQSLFLFLSFFMVLLIPVCYVLISKSYFKPMEALIKTMQKIRDGNIDEKVNSNYKIREFQEVNVTFNQMMTEIKNLKIESWERRLQKNRAELQYLQLQIKPHFFLNCLKNLYGMAELKRYEKMQGMIIQISSYLRYFFNDNMSLVAIGDEINHVKNYISLQKYSLEQDVECEFEIEEQLKDCIIPVLLIQPFVENSFKYGRKTNQTLRITIRIIELAMEEENMLDIIITDNGNGFKQEVLEQLNEQTPYQYTENNVGIANICQRLFLIYGEKAMLQCNNLEDGAQCEMILPVKVPKEQREEKEE